MAGRRIADAGHLALVGHQPGERQPRPARDLLGQLPRRGRGVDRGPLRPDLHPATERPPAGVEVDRDPNRLTAGTRRRLDQVEVLDAVDHQRRRAPGASAANGGIGDRATIGGRVGDHEILEALVGEVKRLGQGEVQEPPEARVEREDPPQQLGASHRLRGDADRLAAHLREHRGGVRAQRIEVGKRERRLELREGALVTRVGRLSAHSVRERIVAAALPEPTIGAAAAQAATYPERWPSG